MSPRLVSNLLALCFGGALSLLVVAPQGEASPLDTTGGQYFQPPTDTRSLRGPVTTTGTRGDRCSNGEDGGPAFSSLGPRSVPGLTTSVRPEFVWYNDHVETASPVLFRLLAIDAVGQSSIVESANLSAQPGFMRYQLPDSAPPLEVGQDYLWQVIVTCAPEQPSKFLANTLLFQVVSPTPELTEALAMATTDVDRAQAYGNAGIWYNALALVSLGTNPTAADIRTGLLQDLARLESSDEIFSAALTAIAEETAPNVSSDLVPDSVTPDL
ncbi:DUF928 domain-containing protein [Leptothoe sp. PORK10 BA2]|uniref:DUF928 domain-containing protein n=1 Tax=Leptothoe sp. PORK10 BA2 TaxID=3110254 RepID=UPI002B21E28E|nr:DUF928 domain-containing protein [Leptothoe sp. PORK10 BA2]MEA5463530.1 DUF928 domain-containing protein [Leptothoe sp. PORK10 BA2]